MTEPGTLCQRLLNGPATVATLWEAEAVLDAALADAASERRKSTSGIGGAWSLTQRFSQAADPAGPEALRALAPVFLLDGIWLARVASPAVGHRPAQGLLLRIYLETMGLEHPVAAPFRRYRARLVNAGVDLPDLGSPRFFLDPGFPASAVQWALLALTLRHRPISRFPELLGFTLAHLSREPAPFDDPGAHALRQRHRGWAEQALACARAEGIDVARVTSGQALYVQAFTRLLDELLARIQSPPPTRERRMAVIVQRKSSEAQGYHRRVLLDGRTLDDWLADARHDPLPLLRALRASPRVDAACPAASRLILAMDFGGPMFGVFDKAERESALDWIENPGAPARNTGGLALDPNQPAPPPKALGAIREHDDGSPHGEAPALPPSPRQGRLASGGGGVSARLKRMIAKASGERAGQGRALRSCKGSRQTYLALLRAESPADAAALAEHCVQRMLRRTRLLGCLGGDTHSLPRSPGALRDFTLRRHRHEIRRYQPLKTSAKVDRDFCRWALMQLAPAILVDGAWLAGINDAAEKLDVADRHLQKIYADELGAGRADWNHPNVYRRLLKSQGLRLPDFASVAFTQSEDLLTAAFEIPVYLLAMGLVDRRFRPELLGLNLAIELSGLGASYLRAIDILRQHGMDPAIIQLHLSIDNLASGHAAQAREAIELYLEELRQREGSLGVERVWRRIRRGYDSLRVASLELTACIVWRYGLHRLGWRVQTAE